MLAIAPKILAVRGTVFHFRSNPFYTPEPACFELFQPGMLLVVDGYVKAVGNAAALEKELPPGCKVIDYGTRLILPGFIDTHLHYPQTDIIGSFGKQLLDWLETYTFPREGKFGDALYAADTADFFLEELLRNGTTTAQVMPTIHKQATTTFFQKALAKNLRMICGKVLMDRNAPAYLQDTPEQGYEDSLELIQQWHNKGRLSYAVTPRFAITSSAEQLEKAGALLETAPGLYLHTHLAENKAEVDWVSRLFPWSASYLDVYDRFGLITSRSTFAHSIYLPEESYETLAGKQAAVSFCPTSNLFIGSGLFNLERTCSSHIKIGIGTDIGGGTTFSILKTLGEAYKVLQLQGQTLSPLKAFYLATLGGAEALDQQDKIGNFQAGKEADFVVLDHESTPLMARRMAEAETIAQKLFLFMILGDDRSIQTTYVMGNKLYQKTN